MTADRWYAVGHQSESQCMRTAFVVLTVCLMAILPRPLTVAQPIPQRTAVGSSGLVVSGNAAATAVGVRIMEQGGNAADAGAATLLALSVTTVGAFCIGGEV